MKEREDRIMREFQSILVGIDILQLKSAVPAEFKPPVEEAIRQSIWLAGQLSAKLTFVAVLDESEHSQAELAIAKKNQIKHALTAAANQVLDELVNRARSSGVNASSSLRFGKGWIELIRQVSAMQHDLLIVGTRDLSEFNRLLLGSTAMKLLRKCPCPVWVIEPREDSQSVVKNVAVASDFSPTSDRALEAAIVISRCANAHLHLVNSVDFPLDRLWSTGLADQPSEEYHKKIRAYSDNELRKQVSRAKTSGLVTPIQTHIVEGYLNVDLAIREFIRVQKIDLLAMGTIARSGITGAFIGNTAESLLPQLSCSVLVVKPTDFVCPVGAE
jgi:universal stress protein E